MKTWRHSLTLITMLIVGLCLIASQALQSTLAQPDLNFHRERGRIMLRTIKDDLKKNYYDPNFRGMDIEARFSAADAKIKEAGSVGQIFGIIAQALIDLNDSHTSFLPPGRANRTEYGWQMQAFGDKVFVSAIKPGSDAEKKGLKTGDQILSVSGFEPWLFLRQGDQDRRPQRPQGDEAANVQTARRPKFQGEADGAR